MTLNLFHLDESCILLEKNGILKWNLTTKWDWQLCLAEEALNCISGECTWLTFKQFQNIDCDFMVMQCYADADTHLSSTQMHFNVRNAKGKWSQWSKPMKTRFTLQVFIINSTFGWHEYRFDHVHVFNRFHCCCAAESEPTQRLSLYL